MNQSALVLHVPHASRVIPPEVRAGIALDDLDLTHELDRMTDSFTDLIAEQAAKLAGVPVRVVAAPVSRLVVDVERFPDERERMNAVGMGAIYTRTHDQRPLREHVDESLLDRWFHPHAARVTAAVADALAERGRVILVDLHSYPTHRLPYELAGQHDPRPSVCLGTDPDHTPAWLVDAARAAFDGLGTALDSPFAGTYVPLAYYGADTRVSSLMIELRRDTYMDEKTVAPHHGLERITHRIARLLTVISGEIV